jgi:hypothetical protein
VLPVAAGDLTLGASSTVGLSFAVPSTVVRFTFTASGSFADDTGKIWKFTTAQTVTP